MLDNMQLQHLALHLNKKTKILFLSFNKMSYLIVFEVLLVCLIFKKRVKMKFDLLSIENYTRHRLSEFHYISEYIERNKLYKLWKVKKVVEYVPKPEIIHIPEALGRVDVQENNTPNSLSIIISPSNENKKCDSTSSMISSPLCNCSMVSENMPSSSILSLSMDQHHHQIYNGVPALAWQKNDIFNYRRNSAPQLPSLPISPYTGLSPPRYSFNGKKVCRSTV